MSELRAVARLALAGCALLLTPFAHAAESAEALLKRADAYRLAADSVKVETRIEVIKNGQLDKERLYTVIARPGRESLVLMRSPAEKGQKVLMKGDDFWMIMPTSQRPIRITPTQKLLGDAAAGDVATLSWSTDYSVTLAGEDKCGDANCRQLSLKARFPSTTYARIELWVDAKSAQPLRADLYVASDKLAKRAQYTTEKVEGVPRVTSMAIDDEIATGRRTVLHYESQRPTQAPEEWFNPMFLTRNEVQP
ncbi:outer membrane lipoprotein-sorting protein [Niveibacterium sp. SC-1]|uniref:outer membrane lipoprotein-sorting protein n=1 Tax=Niveibacterium sp. SC-1 TaxID=3135646 RepID=UPI00311D3209